jgi:hypothetical protein
MDPGHPSKESPTRYQGIRIKQAIRWKQGMNTDEELLNLLYLGLHVYDKPAEVVAGSCKEPALDREAIHRWRE